MWSYNYAAPVCHYGVKGMKWGVRRYQNRDGSLTDEGKRRFQKVSNSNIRRSMNKHLATRIAKNDAKLNAKRAKTYNRAANAAYKRADRYVTKSEKAQARGNEEGFTRNQGKAWKQIAKSYEYGKAADEFMQRSKSSLKLVSDIQSERIKAGRDYIATKELYLTPVGIFVTDSLIRRGQAEIQRNKR